MDRDRALGLVVFLVALVVFVVFSYYSLLASSPLGYNPLGLPNIGAYWVLVIPLWIAVTAVLLIGGWIGWTLFTTPPPVPIEEFEELEDIEADLETPEEFSEDEE